MRLNDPAVLAEVTDAFQRYEKALNDNDVATLTALFWKSPLTIRFGIGENLYGHDAITAFRHARPNIDLRRTLSNTVITTYGDDFATTNTEFAKRDTGRRGRQSQTWMRTEAGWRVVSAHVSFLPAQD
jgi:1-carboxybiuret hydrolase subunit AtzH-like protein